MICRDPPSRIFELGSVIEDVNGIFKVKYRYRSHSGDCYRVEVLKWHIEPPKEILALIDLQNFVLLVTAASEDKIKLLQ